MNRFVTWVSAIVLMSAAGLAQGPSAPGSPYKELAFRSLGPNLTTGRISDVAIDPKNPNVWYVAAAAGNLWKTENRGNTWTPIFENYGSYSLGAVTVDPKDSNVVWLGTGENNNQRSVELRRRRLQVDRRRQDLEAHGARELRAHSEHRRRPAQLERRLRDGDRAAVDVGRRSRSVTRRPTAVRRGRRCCRSAPIPASPTW